MWNILLKLCACQKNVSGELPFVEEICAHSDTSCVTEIRKTMYKSDMGLQVYYETLGSGDPADTPETKEHDVDNS